MLIHLSDVLKKDGEILNTEVVPSMDSFESMLGNFPILEKPPIQFQITNQGKQNLTISCQGSITVGIPCSRCLEEVPTKFSIHVEDKIDWMKMKEDRMNDLEESNYITEENLDVDRLVCDEILVKWPLKVLCKEDCKGICSKCGKNLNQDTCSCDTESLDPRMAVISDIYSKFKEV